MENGLFVLCAYQASELPSFCLVLSCLALSCLVLSCLVFVFVFVVVFALVLVLLVFAFSFVLILSFLFCLACLLLDTHNRHGNLGELPFGDVLLHTGDFSNHGTLEEVSKFAEWMKQQPHKTKVVVPGLFLSICPSLSLSLFLYPFCFGLSVCLAQPVGLLSLVEYSTV
jgi:hypothetical protein